MSYGKISSQRYVSVSTTSASFIEAIPNRVGLIISSPKTNEFTMSLEKSATLSGAGITLHPGTEPLILTAEEHGDLVSRAWSAIISTSGENIGIVEIFKQG